MPQVMVLIPAGLEIHDFGVTASGSMLLIAIRNMQIPHGHALMPLTTIMDARLPHAMI